MRNASNQIAIIAILLAGVLALTGAVAAANLIERRTAGSIRAALIDRGLTWAQVSTDGLRVLLTGTAPTEASRFRALAITGSVVDAARVIDSMGVVPTTPMKAPDFALELLRNEDGVAMIGLIPAGAQHDDITDAVRTVATDAHVTDMLNTSDYPAPDGWDAALGFGLKALALLPRSKISIATGKVSVTAISDSIAQKRKLESKLALHMPKGVAVALFISAPRPVITPFILRFLIDGDGARFDACSADTPDAAKRILDAARAAGIGMRGKGACTVGLGVPSPDWAEAVQAGIGALAQLGGGSITFSDADVMLVAQHGTPQQKFDKVTGALGSALPGVFSLHAVLPAPVAVDGTGQDAAELPEFVATKSPEGLVQLRGVVADDLTRNAVRSYARSRFGGGNMHGRMRLDDTLPGGWPIRVLTGLEGLAKLTHGSVVVQSGFVALQGETSDSDATAHVAQLFSQKLGDAQQYRIDVHYVAPPDPTADMPTPDQCISSIKAILADQKISFQPGSATIDGSSRKVIDGIAKALDECPDVDMEIGGHTDSQGREEMNQRLSQQRAEAVLNALIARRVLTTHITAKGYGESEPIAQNDTESGREANRRIEFTLIVPQAVADGAALAAAVADAPVIVTKTGDGNAADPAPAAAADNVTGIMKSMTDSANGQD